MKGILTVFGFVALTFLSWGAYGPVLHTGQEAMTGPDAIDLARLRPFICVGLAYFLIAVIVPVLWLRMKSEQGQWTLAGALWSVVAGALGAVGALGIIMAFGYRGSPLYVMPLVFGGAPVVNTFVTMWMARSYKEVGRLFFAGLVLVIAGSVIVLISKPKPGGDGLLIRKSEKTDEGVSVHVETETNLDDVKRITTTDMDRTENDRYEILITEVEGDETTTTKITKSQTNQFDVAITVRSGSEETRAKNTLDGVTEFKDWDAVAHKKYVGAMKLFRRLAPLEAYESLMIGLSIALVVVCWGAYGPVLHKGQMKMSGSRLRPLLCVGMAYFAIAVVVPSILISGLETEASFTFTGTMWSLLAGTAGVLGALGIIMAFNFGGKPIFVMPLVFGGAPVVNSAISIIKSKSYGEPMFFVGLAVVIVGAATVLVFAPKGGHAPPAKAES